MQPTVHYEPQELLVDKSLKCLISPLSWHHRTLIVKLESVVRLVWFIWQRYRW